MKKIPEEVYALAALLSYFRNSKIPCKQSGEFILNHVKELIDGVKKFIEYIISLIKEIMKSEASRFSCFTVNLSMLLSAGIMYEEIQEIGKLRSKGK
jgi:hypothetical protein